ncbi:SpoVR family protein [Candidatus Halobonum tyrrellensis]|uniref:Stage V sporulation protein R-like protein n=1 Tax=Candidatus Halobonum tyrrellensis G22 TaxID=1324957 RepID=V4HLP8_9EURY|nr:SpoVR family protein [Candidatus Halobonum tyrrellensis]ESP88824.1 stage V sporulation protein R-like protein [Candidatus Halobonum tyrrellensis G22]
MKDDRIVARREAARLEEPAERARELAERLGLRPYPVNYWVVDYDEMNELIAYDGFQTRYPHWRWGMKYDRQRKQDAFGMGKAFEIVNNDNPCHAFLQESNSLADQKAVITHVEAHADFFRNNEWFGRFAGDDEEPDAAAMLERHAETIAGYMDDPETDRGEVERFIDAALCLEDTIDQHRALAAERGGETAEEFADVDIDERLDRLGLSSEVRDQVFDDEWVEAQEGREHLAAPRPDVLAYLREHGERYDDEEGKATEREPWMDEVLELLRREAYYFAPQKLTKVMNEGWAAYWESLMMAEEGFAGTDEFLTYADHQSRVLGSPGLNPYKLGKELWEYVENAANRREVVDRLLRVRGVSWRNFHDTVDFDTVREALAPDPALEEVRSDTLDRFDPDDPRVDADGLERARAGEIDADRYPWAVLSYEGLCERHFSLAKPAHRGFLERVGRSELEQAARYMFDDEVYASVEEALADVDYGAGWARMREVRESHNDVTFIDEFLTREFVVEGNYFTYEYSRATDDYRVASTDPDDVKRKLLLRFTNFGKPSIAVYDGNFDNRGELLLGHRYNGVALDLAKAESTLERVFELWGRPVNLATIVTEYDDHELEVARRRGREPDGEEVGVRLRYDGDGVEHHELDAELEARIGAAEVDYDTKPDDWLA